MQVTERQQHDGAMHTDDVRAQDASGNKTKLPRPEGPTPDCPRCGADADKVKFAYYNNKNLSQVCTAAPLCAHRIACEPQMQDVACA